MVKMETVTGDRGSDSLQGPEDPTGAHLEGRTSPFS